MKLKEFLKVIKAETSVLIWFNDEIVTQYNNSYFVYDKKYDNFEILEVQAVSNNSIYIILK